LALHLKRASTSIGVNMKLSSFITDIEKIMDEVEELHLLLKRHGTF
jgi:hypothetical protein